MRPKFNIRPSAQIHGELNERNAFLMGGDLNARNPNLIHLWANSHFDLIFEDSI